MCLDVDPTVCLPARGVTFQKEGKRWDAVGFGQRRGPPLVRRLPGGGDAVGRLLELDGGGVGEDVSVTIPLLVGKSLDVVNIVQVKMKS